MTAHIVNVSVPHEQRVQRYTVNEKPVSLEIDGTQRDEGFVIDVERPPLLDDDECAALEAFFKTETGMILKIKR